MATIPTDAYVVALDHLSLADRARVGGKAANLGELTRLEGVAVPPGVCVTTDAFRHTIERTRAAALISRLNATDTDLTAELRQTIEEVPFPTELVEAIAEYVDGDGHAWAVRSSATAEDLSTASFAGQHDTYLNITGAAAVLRHIACCFASLFTDRAVAYRIANGVDHRQAAMAVVVQQMLAPEASGVLFTADPVSGHRKVTVVEAVTGIAEALVAGAADADVFRMSGGQIDERKLRRNASAALTDAQVIKLAELGHRIEGHFRRPQDIEWCLVNGEFQIVQSRPITTLFPVPDTGDDGNHVFISVGHQQMMTDAMRPLGISVWQLTAGRPMYEAAGRLFVDVTQALASPAIRPGLLAMVGRSDPLIGDALRTVAERADFLPAPPDTAPGPPPGAAPVAEPPGPGVVAELVAEGHRSLAELRQEIATRSGEDVCDFILSDIDKLKAALTDPRSSRAILAGMEAVWTLGDRLEEWLGETDAAGVITQSAPDNITAEMGLALLDVADAIRPYPHVVAFLGAVTDGDFLDDLAQVTPGGPPASAALGAWLEKYGMRGVGEIDLTRPRWSERPAALVPVILANVSNFEPGESRRRFEQGERTAAAKEREVLARLRELPDGADKAVEAKRLIDQARGLAGYREWPKHFIVGRYFAYKQALLAEAERMAGEGTISEPEDIFYLRFEELAEVIRRGQVDPNIIEDRKEAHRAYQRLTPPRVITSDGEAVTGSYRRADLPPGALAGLAVSAGTVEGRARVMADMAEAHLQPGDILVTNSTDPSWTPLFLTAAALVTEVGGLMTHGAVIAREYGLPAVVGVVDATGLIADGQRIRVNGTDGYVEILS